MFYVLMTLGAVSSDEIAPGGSEVKDKAESSSITLLK